MGRNSSYKKEYAGQAKNLCLLGATDKEIANSLGTSEQTLNKWKKDFPEFLESLKEGKDLADAKVANSLYQKALSGDTVACIFWLKNRRKDAWRDKSEVKQSGSLNVSKTVVVLPAKEKK